MYTIYIYTNIYSPSSASIVLLISGYYFYIPFCCFYCQDLEGSRIKILWEITYRLLKTFLNYTYYELILWYHII